MFSGELNKCLQQTGNHVKRQKKCENNKINKRKVW